MTRDGTAGRRCQEGLFLGGSDDVTNLTRSDMEVDWHLMGELRAATQALAPGTGITSIRIDE